MSKNKKRGIPSKRKNLISVCTPTYRVITDPNKERVVCVMEIKVEGRILPVFYCYPHNLTPSRAQIEKILNKRLGSYVSGTISYNSNGVGFTTIGISRVHPNDEFDEKKGKKVAKTKALKKSFIIIREIFKILLELQDKNCKILIKQFNDWAIHEETVISKM